jgi:hypothetical protein
VFMTRERGHELSGESPAVLLCGAYVLDQARPHPLLAELPDVFHLRAGDGGDDSSLRAAIDLLWREHETQRPGGGAVVPALLDMLLLYIIRTWLDTHPSTQRSGHRQGAARHPPRPRARMDGRDAGCRGRAVQSRVLQTVHRAGRPVAARVRDLVAHGAGRPPPTRDGRPARRRGATHGLPVGVRLRTGVQAGVRHLPRQLPQGGRLASAHSRTPLFRRGGPLCRQEPALGSPMPEHAVSRCRA